MSTSLSGGRAGKCDHASAASCDTVRLKKDPEGGGLEKDYHTRSTKYCSLCYGNGAFLQPVIKVTSMQHLVIHALQREGRPKPLAWMASRGIPRLDRWTGKP